MGKGKERFRWGRLKPLHHHGGRIVSPKLGSLLQPKMAARRHIQSCRNVCLFGGSSLDVSSQLSKLRMEAHESKSLPQQISIMQQVVDRKEVVYSETNLKMEQCRSNLEMAREKCMAADASLQECKDKLQDLVAKCSLENNASQPQQVVSEHQL